MKDALAKKEAVRKQKVPSGASTLSGAGERVRGWLSSEVEFEVTSKEQGAAHQGKEGNDRGIEQAEAGS